jgi:hypothetical protein
MAEANKVGAGEVRTSGCGAELAKMSSCYFDFKTDLSSGQNNELPHHEQTTTNIAAFNDAVSHGTLETPSA